METCHRFRWSWSLRKLPGGEVLKIYLACLASVLHFFFSFCLVVVLTLVYSRYAVG